MKNVATRDRHPVTPDLIEQHLNGSGAFKAIGYCPGTAEGTSTGLIDLDTKDYPEPGTLDDARRRVLGIAGANEIYLHVERSTSGGYHLHCFSSSLLPYPIIRAALIEIATRADLAKIEVYPSTAGARGQWVILPYAAANRDERQLGNTHLTTPEGDAIPLDTLAEWIKLTPAAHVQQLANSELGARDSVGNGSSNAMGHTMKQLAPEAWDRLTPTLLAHQPIDRHGGIIAVLNFGRRCGRESEAIKFLKSDELHRVWVPDKTRDSTEWSTEIDRWASAQSGQEARGIPFLIRAGFEFPDDLPALEKEWPDTYTNCQRSPQRRPPCQQK